MSYEQVFGSGLGTPEAHMLVQLKTLNPLRTPNCEVMMHITALEQALHDA